MSQPITPHTAIEFVVNLDQARRAEVAPASEWVGWDDDDPQWADQDAVVEALQEACAEWTASQADSGWGPV
jgi:hypothetical protein